MNDCTTGACCFRLAEGLIGVTLLLTCVEWLGQYIPGPNASAKKQEANMSDSVYKIIELVGTSKTSWEDAAKNAVESAGKSLKNLRIAEVGKLDMKVEDGKVAAYRARVSVSFKYEGK